MIKIFHTIRQRMLNENRFSRYLLYAIGEIVLVVIGILIALQLNAWKAAQKDAQLATSHLEGLLEDLQLQLEIIDAQMIHDTTMTVMADSAFLFFSKERSIGDLNRVLYGSGNLGYRKTFVTSDATFKEMLSTGGIKLIADRDLRRGIMRYYQQLDYTKSVVNTNNGLIDQLFNLNAANNSPSFSLDAHGNLDTTAQLSGHDRYRLHQSITARRNLSGIALGICDKQRDATLTLMSKVNDAIRPNQASHSR